MSQAHADSFGRDKEFLASSPHSIVQDFFLGIVDENQIFPYPHLDQESRELGRDLVNGVKKFAEERIHSEKMDEDSVIPEEVIAGLAELGMMGLAVDEQYGGLQLNYGLYARIFSEIAGYDGSIATMLGAHQSIGYRALLLAGTPEQKEKWLPKLATGEILASFCLTEPGSGSDAYSIKTKAIDNKDGTYTLTGQKLWITNAGSAEFYSVFCKTDHIQADGKSVEKISCFIVEKNFPGVSFGEKEKKMGIKASETRAVYFDKVIVPAENVLGELGQGFKLAMNVLNSGRLSLGSGALGAMKKLLSMSIEHSQNRQQFGKKISEFGLIQEKITDMMSLCYAVENMVYFSTGKIDRRQKDYSLESAICKVYGSEALWSVVDMSMQIAAGNGYMKEYPYERLMRDSRINLIFEGTNEILRVLISLTGIRGPSEKLKELSQVKDVSQALKDPIKSLGLVSDFAKSRLEKMFVHNSFTSLSESLQEQGDILIQMTKEFSIAVEKILMKYGKKIIQEELLQKNIANSVIELYVMSTTLSRTQSILQDDKLEKKDKDFALELTQYLFKKSRYQIIGQLKEMRGHFNNLKTQISQKSCEIGGYPFDIL